MLTELARELAGFGKVAVIGLGSELRSDDQVGIRVAEKLRDALPNEKIEVLIGGTTPENLSGVLRKMRPSHIILIDAAGMGKEAGTAALVDPKTIKGPGFSTHTFSLATITDYLKEISGAKIIFIGIEPKTVEFGEALSEELKPAVYSLAEELRAALL